MEKKRDKKYNPYKQQNLKLQIFEITPTQHVLDLLKKYVKRGYLACTPVQEIGLAEFYHEYHLIVYILQHLFFLQLCNFGNNKVRKYFVSIRDGIIRYLDKLENASVYDGVNDVVILPSQVTISPILAGKIIFVVDNNYKIMTRLSSRQYVDIVTEASSMFNIWCGMNPLSSVHLLLDYVENIKVSNNMSKYIKSRRFKNERQI